MESSTGSIQNKLQFDNMVRELMREKVDMVSHAIHHVYTRTKKERRMIGQDKEIKERRLDEIYFLNLS